MSSKKLMIEHVSTNVILKEPEHWTAIITFASNPGRIHYSAFIRLHLNDLVKDPIKTLTMSGFHAVHRELEGKDVILFFYPKDHTPGCTKEASGFQTLLADIRKAKRGVVVLGVSMDDAESHKRFRKDYQLRFDLLTDANHKVMEKYEAYGEKMMYGKPRMGVIRSTVWIGKDGKVVKHWRRVPKAADHPQKVLDALTA